MTAAPAPVAHRGQCPHCGAPLEFLVGSSRSAVCAHCQTLVARRGQDYQELGSVAELIPTGTQLALNDTGRYAGNAFRIVGRLQYQWMHGAWDEWYISLDDGRWGWLAEAQGRYYVTFRTTPRTLPPPDGIEPDQSLTVSGLGRWTITDIKVARIVAASGELPDEVALNTDFTLADLEGPRHRFGTIDYGDRSGTPMLYIGDQVLLPDLAIHDPSGGAAALNGPRVATDKLACPNCHAPVTLLVPGQTVHLVCEHCGGLLDTSQGPLRLVTVLRKLETRSPIPIGSSGKLCAKDWIVVGWMQRSCEVAGVTYPWEELLLYEPQTTGYAWLVRADGHWQLAEPISAGAVASHASNATFEGHAFRLFSSVVGKVDEVWGEFPWAVGVGESAQIDDFIRPPEGLSRELTGRELNWSHLRHVESADVAAAFQRPGLAQESQPGVGEIQPWPYEQALRTIDRWMLGGVAVAVALLFVFIARGRSIAMSHSFSPDELRTADATQVEGTPPGPCGSNPGGPCAMTFVSEPFELHGNRAIEIRMETNAWNSWVWAEGGLIPTEGSDWQPFELETAYYTGSDSDGEWSEGARESAAVLPALQGGQHVLRADFQWDPKQLRLPSVELNVIEGDASLWQFLFVVAALGLGALLHLGRGGFERRRWENATEPQFSGGRFGGGE
jgi:hypothetical protein